MTAIAENPLTADLTVVESSRARLEMIDPTRLTISTNVRSELDMTPEFLASIKQHGVLQPIVAQLTDEGAFHVLYGQRRTVAAVDAGLTEVPVYISETQAEADRIAKQVVENDQRATLTDADRAEAYHQMALLGVSPTQIAKRTGAKKATVEDAIKAKSDDTASSALGRGLTIGQSVTLAEFADDEKVLVELEATALEQPGMFEHAVQRAKDARNRAATIAVKVAEMREKGLTILDEDPTGYWYKGPWAVVRDLTKADGSPVGEDYADAVYVTMDYNDNALVRYVVTDWKGRGLRKSGKGGGMTDEQKAERKELIANNRDMDSAILVRKAWVTELLARKTAPKAAAAFIAASIAGHNYLVSKGISTNLSLAGEFLGGKEIEHGYYAKVAARPAKADTAILAAVLAGFESDMTRQSWRNPQAAHRHYLKQLVLWGYAPAEVEKIIIGG